MFQRLFFSGTVLSSADPEGLGRVKVKLNGFSSEPGKIYEGQWLRVMTPAAGGMRGLYWLPEVDDEVVVAQLGGPGDFFVLGCLFNGLQRPPRANLLGMNQTKVFKTRGGNEITLTDTPTFESIELKTPNGTCEVRLENSTVLPKVSVKAPIVDLYTPPLSIASATSLASAGPMLSPPGVPPIPPAVTPTPLTQGLPESPQVPDLPLAASLPIGASEAPICQIKMDSRGVLGPRIKIEAPVIELSTPIPPPPVPSIPGAPPPPSPPTPPPTLFRMELAGAKGPRILMMAPTITMAASTVEILGTLMGPVPQPPNAGLMAATMAAITTSVAASIAADAADLMLEVSARAAEMAMSGEPLEGAAPPSVPNL